MKTCPKCGQSVQPGDAFCDNCGAPLSVAAAPPPGPAMPAAAQAPMVGGATCPSCGFAVVPGEAFCENCGVALDQAPLQPVGGTGTQVMTPKPTPAPVAPPPGALAGMISCPQCGTQLQAGSTFCDTCGASVGGVTVPPQVQAPYQPPVQQPPAQAPYQPPVQQPPAQAPYQPPIQQPPAQASYQQPFVSPGVAAPTQARVVVQKSSETLPFPQGQTEVIVGREDPVSGHFADIDLTDHGGDEGGVSRKHARFIFQDGRWYLEDLNSVNGSWVNPRTTRRQLQQGQPWPLNNGDEVRFGRVVLTFYA